VEVVEEKARTTTTKTTKKRGTKRRQRTRRLRLLSYFLSSSVRLQQDVIDSEQRPRDMAFELEITREWGVEGGASIEACR